VFVALDEISLVENCRPVYGYAKRGERLFVKKRQASITTTSRLAAIQSYDRLRIAEQIGSFSSAYFVDARCGSSVPHSSALLVNHVAFDCSNTAVEYEAERNIEMLPVSASFPCSALFERIVSVAKSHSTRIDK